MSLLKLFIPERLKGRKGILPDRLFSPCDTGVFAASDLRICE